MYFTARDGYHWSRGREPDRTGDPGVGVGCLKRVWVPRGDSERLHMAPEATAHPLSRALGIPQRSNASPTPNRVDRAVPSGMRWPGGCARRIAGRMWPVTPTVQSHCASRTGGGRCPGRGDLGGRSAVEICTRKQLRQYPPVLDELAPSYYAGPWCQSADGGNRVHVDLRPAAVRGRNPAGSAQVRQRGTPACWCAACGPPATSRCAPGESRDVFYGPVTDLAQSGEHRSARGGRCRRRAGVRR